MHVEVGVYCPLSLAKEYLTSFQVKTPRTILLCLDLIEMKLKFWLNGKRQKKVLDLPIQGPYIPCVKIGKEKNTLSLNPFVSLPSNCYESLVDRTQNLEDLLMPYLQNSLCITKLPPDFIQDNQIDTAKAFCKNTQISLDKIKKIHYLPSNPENSFCYIQLHHYTSMLHVLEQIEKLDSKPTVYQPYQIVEWFRNKRAPESLQQAFAIIAEAIQIQSSTRNECYELALQLISKDFKPQSIQQEKDCRIKLEIQPFTDKLILTQDMSVKIVSRDSTTNQFNLNQVILTSEIQTINSKVMFTIPFNDFKFLMDHLPWNEILQKRQPEYFGAIKNFFKGLLEGKLNQNFLIFQVQLHSAKFAIESLVFNVKKIQLKIQKYLQQFICQVEKPKPYEYCTSFEQLPDNQANLCEIEKMLLVLHDLEEQLYAKTRSELSISEVKNLCQKVSMPSSPLNKLGVTLGQITQIPSKSLNYLVPQKLICDQILISQNSPFMLFGNIQRGSITICSSLLQATPLITCQFFSIDIEEKHQKYSKSMQNFYKKMKDQYGMQASINKKQTVQPWFLELGGDVNKSDGVKKIKKDSKKVKPKSEVIQQAPILQYVENESFNIIANETQETTQFKQTIKQDSKEAKDQSFFLICKDHGRCIDPFLVGMIYSYGGVIKVKVRRIVYSIGLLAYFSKQNVYTGNQINQINKVQSMQGKEDFKNINVLKQVSCFIDQYPLFIRNQNIAKHYPQNDQKFNFFTEASGCEIELNGVNRVIDYSKTQYCVESKEILLMLVDAVGLELREYHIVINKQSKTQIILKAVKQVNGFTKVFLIEQFAVVCSESQVHIYSLGNFELLRQIEHRINLKLLNVINQTPKDQFLNQKNLEELGNLPPQTWSLAFGENLIQITECQKSVTDQQDELEISSISLQDIKGIQNLFKTEPKADLSFKCEQVELQEKSYVFYNIQGKSELEFEFKSNRQISHITIQLEVEINKPIQAQSHQSQQPLKLFESPKPIPLQLVNSDRHIRHVINKEQLLPSTMVCPDQSVYTSNYSEPEFTFQSPTPIVLTSVQIWSKINREILFGYPVGEGLVYAALNLEDLRQTKRMDKKEFVQWAKTRQGPLMPHEPILYFDMKSEQKISIPVRARNVQFFKFVPTQLRRQPINYADAKLFKNCKVEVQFFGVQGIPIATQPAKIKNQVAVITNDNRIEIKDGFKVDRISSGVSPINPVVILNEKLIPLLCGSTQTIDVPLRYSQDWQKLLISTQGILKVTITANYFQNPLLSSKLAPFQDQIRQNLLSSEFTKYVKPIIEQFAAGKSTQIKIGALDCLEFLGTQFTKENKKLLNDFISQTLKAEEVLQNFGQFSDTQQKRIINFLNQNNTVQNQSETVDRTLLNCLTEINLEDCSNKRTLPHTLQNLLLLASSQITKQVTQKIEQIFTKELAIQCTKEISYFQIRQKLNLNTFPFDLPSFNPCRREHEPLPLTFNLTRINTFTSIKLQLHQTCQIEEMRLLVRQDASKVHRLLVTVIDSQQKICFQKQFDQSQFNCVAEKMHKHAVVDYFQNVNQDTNEFLFKLSNDGQMSIFDRLNQQHVTQIFNYLPLDFQAQGQNFEIQIELMDSYRSVHKGMLTSQVLITPEVFGYQIENKQEHSNFPKYLHLNCSGRTRIGGIVYKVYKLPQLVNDYVLEMSNEASPDFDQRSKKILGFLNERCIELRQFIADAAQSDTKQLIKMIGQVNKLKLELRELYTDNNVQGNLKWGSNLQYSLQMGKVIVEYLSKNLQSCSDVQSIYSTLVKCFVLTDCGHEVTPVLRSIINSLEAHQQQSLIFRIIDEFYIKPVDSINMNKLQDFILNQLPKVDINNLLQHFLDIFQVENRCLIPKIQTYQDCDQAVQDKEKSKFRQRDVIPALILLKQYPAKNQVNLCLLIRLIAAHCNSRQTQITKAYIQISCELLQGISNNTQFHQDQYDADLLVLVFHVIQSRNDSAQQCLIQAIKSMGGDKVINLLERMFNWLSSAHQGVNLLNDLFFICATTNPQQALCLMASKLQLVIEKTVMESNDDLESIQLLFQISKNLPYLDSKHTYGLVFESIVDKFLSLEPLQTHIAKNFILETIKKHDTWFPLELVKAFLKSQNLNNCCLEISELLLNFLLSGNSFQKLPKTKIVKAQLSRDQLQLVFRVTVPFMTKNCKFSSLKVQSKPPKNLVVLNKLLQLLLHHDSKCQFDEDLFENLIGFMITNQSGDDKKQKSVAQKIEELIHGIGDANPSQSLQALIKAITTLDQTLQQSVKSKHLSDVVVYEISQAINQRLSQYVERWLNGPQEDFALSSIQFFISRLVADQYNESACSDESQGEENSELISFMEQQSGLKLTNTSIVQYQSEKKIESEMLKQAKRLRPALTRHNASPPAQKKVRRASDVDNSLVVVEFNKDMKLVDSSEGMIKFQWNTQGLLDQALGIANLNLSLKPEFLHQYYLVFDLGCNVQLDQIQIKFVNERFNSYNSTTYPQDVIIEGYDEDPSKNILDPRWRALLNKIQRTHDGFIIPYAAVMSSVCGMKQAQFLKILLLNGKQLDSKNQQKSQQIIYSIYSISIQGTKSREIQQTLMELNQRRAESAVKSMSLILQNLYQSDVQQSTTDALAQMVIENFEVLCSTQHLQYLKSICDRLCKHSDIFCDWLIRQLLQDDQTYSCSFQTQIQFRKSLLQQILSSNNSFTIRRLVTVFDQIKIMARQLIPNTKNVTSLIKALLYNISILKRFQHQEIKLEIDIDELMGLLRIQFQCSKDTQRRVLSCFLAKILPKDFQIQDIQNLSHEFELMDLQLTQEIIENLLQEISVQNYSGLFKIYNTCTQPQYQFKRQVIRFLLIKAITLLDQKQNQQVLQLIVLTITKIADSDQDLISYVIAQVNQLIDRKSKTFSSMIKLIVLPILETVNTTDVMSFTRIDQILIPFYYTPLRQDNQFKIDSNLLSQSDMQCISNNTSICYEKFDLILDLNQKQIKDKHSIDQLGKILKGNQNLILIAHCLFQTDSFVLAGFSFNGLSKTASADIVQIQSSKQDFGFFSSEQCGPSIVNFNQQNPFLKIIHHSFDDYVTMMTWFGSIHFGANSSFSSMMNIRDVSFSNPNCEKFVSNIQRQIAERNLGDYSVYRLEIWGAKHNKQTKIVGKKLAKTLPYYNPLHLNNYSEQNLVFSVPSQMTLHELRKTLQIDDSLAFEGDQNQNVQYAANHGTLVLQRKTQQQVIEAEPAIYQQIYTQAFKRDDGYLHLFQAAQIELQNYRNKELKELLYEFVNTSLGLTTMFPLKFLNEFLTAENEQLLFSIIKHDQSDKISQQDLKFLVSKISKILDRAFDIAKKLVLQGSFDLFQNLINIFNQSSGSFVRSIGEVEKRSQVVQKKKKPTDDSQKKGIGFTSDAGQLFDLNYSLQKKSIKNSKISNLFDMMTTLLKKSETSETIKQIIVESSVIPALETALRSTTALELQSFQQLYASFLQFIQVLANQYVELFDKLDPSYEPIQTESLFNLIGDICDNSQVYLDQSSNDSVADLYRQFISIHTYLKSRIKADDQINLNQSLQQIYVQTCSPLRFQKFDMKVDGTFQHHFHKEVTCNGKPPQFKMIRIAQEFTTLSKDLPMNITDSVFVIIDQNRSDLMKFMIMGAQGTPYANGGFIFDLYLPNEYPNKPPKVNLATTGNGQIRFNPNLYNCGKVCLSLLGTWQIQSTATENWQPNISTIFQVILSIGCTLMVEDIIFNEPGEEQKRGTVQGTKQNNGYCNVVKYGTAKYAILENLRNLPAGFEQAIIASFFVKKDVILSDLRQWIEQADTQECSYTGFTEQHNRKLAQQFSEDPGSYKKCLQEVYDQIEQEFIKLESPKWEQKHKQKMVQDLIIQETKSEKINVEDDEVKDRWSRYIGAMGIESVAKQAQTNVLVINIGALGVETCKNVVLSGCKELIIADRCQPEWTDLCGQFFLSADDVKNKNGRTRAELSRHKLQELNQYVKVSSVNYDKLIELKEVALKCKTVVITDYSRSGIIKQEVIDFCNEIRDQCQVIVADQSGLFCRIVNDFNCHTVMSKQIQQPEQVFIGDVQSYNESQTLIVTLNRHDLQDGDIIQFSEIKGVESLNGQQFQVKQVLSQRSFTIEYKLQQKYSYNGVIIAITQPNTLQFDSISQVLQDHSAKYFDDNFWQSDIDMMAKQRCCSVLFKSYDNQSREEFIQLVKQLCEDLELALKLADIFWKTKSCSFGPLAAFMGGVVSQEIFKGITQKFTPIKQEMYFDASELYSEFTGFQQGNLSECLATCLGDFSRVETTKLFMVGAGAIGCELLKNFAMIGLGTKGKIIITDPDVIEVSNLSRQFLFREQHVRKPKSLTAAIAATQMNPDLVDHIQARLDKLHEATSQTYSEQFFASQDIVANALDNVAARKYVDQRCLQSRTALIDSGTQGMLGHVQVIVPFKTETYSSQEDPEDDTQIPVCTLKMFPEETMHCVEWAKELFAKKFTINPQTVAQTNNENFLNDKSILKVQKMTLRAPQDFESCIALARKSFQKKFYDDVVKLIEVYPLDKVKDDGKPFWSFPKRPPTPSVFDCENELHQSFIASYACLIAMAYKIEIPQNSRKPQMKAKFASFAQKIQTETKEIIEIQDTQIQPPSMRVQEFDKDCDRHVDFIHACANIRAVNYNLQPMDWMTVKIKAGRIIPALSTTTSVIAGLQTLEILKIIINREHQTLRNAYVNLGLPTLHLSEPFAPQSKKISNQLSVTVWDRWDYELSDQDTLGKLLQQLELKTGFEFRDIIIDAQIVYSHFSMNTQRNRLDQDELVIPFKELLISKQLLNSTVDLTITFADGDALVQDIPTIRVTFK